MKNFLLLLLCLIFLHGCTGRENTPIEERGVPTSISGNVYDYIKQQNVKGYKIKFIKSWRNCSNWMCGWASETIGETTTDENGNYKIDFLYKLKEGEIYGLEELYYGTPYYPEYPPSEPIFPGKSNIKNIKVWQPIKLTINLKFKNNLNPSLTVGNRLAETDSYLFNTEFNYEKEGNKTLNFRTKPNSKISIDFWYYLNYNSPNPIRHLYSVPYTTGTDDITLNFDIDCATF